ncbi:MAG: protein-export chaperone SecB [Acidobacteria bacterium]|nr:protein-export chaperone SecB [Acidobacteriota bacterium]
MSETQSAPQPGDAARRFVLQRIYLKDLSFESPASPQLFSADWQPQVRLEIGTRSTEVADSIYEVIIQITITAEQEGKTAFLIEVQQAGLFHITGIEERLMPQVLQVTCPTVLFPYVRETVDTMALKGSIPPLLLAPIDFEALRRQMEEVRQQESDASGLS